MTTDDVLMYKQAFRECLEPFLNFLHEQRESMTVGNWLELVERFQARITINSAEYLGMELPEPDRVKEIINAIFDDLILNDGGSVIGNR
jgi:hypothetical protein